MGTRRQMSRKPSRETMDDACEMARRETATKARDWLRDRGYVLTRKDEGRLFYDASSVQITHVTRHGWRILKSNDPELLSMAGSQVSMSKALDELRSKKISVPRYLEELVAATVESRQTQQPALKLVDARQQPEPATATADTILAAVRLATGKATKADIAAVAKAIGADAAIKLLTTGA